MKLRVFLIVGYILFFIDISDALAGRRVYLLQGDYPDPSVVRVGNSYYMTHSAMDYVPGLTVYHSRDLRHWAPVSYALEHYIGSVWAPDICYHKGKYYIYFTVAAKGKPFKNYVVWSFRPDGGWSAPVDLHVDGKIDPCHIVDIATGERWLFLSTGKRVRLSDDGLSAQGKQEHVYSGWPIPRDWEIESTSLEGPKLKYIEPYYYYLSAEGGTAGPATSHMVVVARSKSLGGPWENMPSNPLIHTWSAEERWWSKGHGTLIDTPEGDLYCIFHTYERHFSSNGRNTMMEPVAVKSDGWLEAPCDRVIGSNFSVMTVERQLNTFRIGLDWKFYKDFDRKRVQCTDGVLELVAKGSSPAESSPLMFIAGASRYELTVKVTRQPDSSTTAGIVLYYNKNFYAGIGFDGIQRYRYRRGEQARSGSFRGNKPLWLKIRMYDNILSAYSSYDGAKWNKEVWSVDVSGYNHNTLGDYQSVLPGLFAFGNGKVTFTNLDYKILE